MDIHCGGVDNIFPHHTNEIAQSESCLLYTSMENIMEKEPTLIEQKFEDAVKNFRKEMEKGKESMQYVLCKL